MMPSSMAARPDTICGNAATINRILNRILNRIYEIDSQEEIHEVMHISGLCMDDAIVQYQEGRLSLLLLKDLQCLYLDVTLTILAKQKEIAL